MSNNNLSVQVLNPFTLPLENVRLIEASAGTGKTYTITTLYLRLILGHECQALSPEQILVVTFTRAATDELKDRIRKRLKQAHDALKYEAFSKDPFIEHLKDLFKDETFKTRSIQRLSDAQQVMDLASIFTIHGFCQRMLSQNAFEAKGGFEDQLTLEESQFMTQAIRDVWRRLLYPMESRELDIVLQRWRTPDMLEYEAKPFVHKNLAFYFGKDSHSSNGSFEEQRKSWEVLTEKLADQWMAKAENLEELLLNHPQKNGQFIRFLKARMEAVERILSAPDTINKDDLKKLSYLCQDQIGKAVKKGGQPPQHELIELLTQWFDENQIYQTAKKHWQDQWFVKSIEQIRQRLLELKQQRQVLAPDDLLSGLHHAIHDQNGSTLIEQIRRQYPVSMVDEFQDTDGLQYGIFQALYVADIEQINQQRQADDQGALALFMIGDPKQAIYKFRGADIFTYIKAKHEVQGTYSLDTNYRSTSDMVTAVNQIFSQHSEPFIYDTDIPFQAVNSADKGSPLFLDKKKQPALTWQVFKTEEKPNKAFLNHLFADSTAESISTLLNKSQQAGHEQGAEIDGKPVQARDIAILVRNARQAEYIKQALHERGIASVYVGRDNIFATEEALSLYSLLQAIYEQNERSFKNALVHPIWSLSLKTIEQLNHDEILWEQQLEALHQGLKDWQQKGVMTMLTNWLHHRDLPSLWLQAAKEGERRLTNVLHLAEILQQASIEQQGMQGLLSWFAHQLANANGENETQQLRLESDENLVQITTLHKSKGLEYPIVFMPFLWDGKASQDKVFYDAEAQQAVCDLSGDYQTQIQTEGLAEEIRLLYVGLTRAVGKCYVSIYTSDDDKHLSNINSSALKYCLAGHDISFHDVLPVLERLSNDQPDVWEMELVQSNHESLKTPFKAQQQHSVSAERMFNGDVSRQWRLASFSSLIKKIQTPETPKFDLDDDQNQHDTAENDLSEPAMDLAGILELERQVESEEQEAENTQQELNAFTFPRGAHAGNFLHNLLEEVDFTQPSCEENRDQAIQLMERYGFESDLWLDVVMEWLNQILITPLQHPNLSLSQLSQHQKLVEMEFYFPVSQLKAQQLNNLLAQYPCLNVPFNLVEFADLQGMLKGFVDLIFEWQGQYFILDYKSNHLGDECSDYHQTALHQAMAKNRYDIQMVIYTLALHRLLKLRIPDYDYDKHIGGGYYLFLRGMHSEKDAPYGQYFHKPDRKLIEALDGLISHSHSEEEVA